MTSSRKVILVANTDWYLYNFKQSFLSFLEQNGFQIIIVSPVGYYSERIKNLGIRHIGWTIGRQSILPWQELYGLWKLVGIYRNEKPDIVHHFTVKPVLYGSIAAKLSGVPSVINAITGRGYTLLANEWKARLIRPVVSLLYQIAFTHSNMRVIFENEIDQDYFLHAGYVSRDKCDLIEGVGVDVEKFFPVPEPQGIPVVTYVGRLLWDKGVGIFVDSARILKGKLAAKFVLVGIQDVGNPSNIPEEKIQLWVDEGLIEWAGWYEDVKSAYDSSNLIVLPSFYEGVPTVLLEAAACARAIVASDIPGNRIVVEDQVTGLIVPVNDAEALVVGIEKLLLAPELRSAMGAAGRERIIRSFTTQRINHETFAVYKKLNKMIPSR